MPATHRWKHNDSNLDPLSSMSQRKGTERPHRSDIDLVAEDMQLMEKLLL